MKNNKLKKIIINILFLVVGLAIGISIPRFWQNQDETAIATKVDYAENRRNEGKWTNPLLSCDIGEEVLTNPLGVSRFRVKDLTDKKIANGDAELISVYFRDLNNGPWFGLREREEFMGGSLLKVPLMIAFLKEAETNPSMLDKKIRYGKINPSVSLHQFFQPTKEIKLGNEYTIWQLIEFMIKYSDNNAADLLGQNIDPLKILQTFSSLGIGLPDFNQPYPTSVRTYASFFRVLYNASYLSIPMSEKALDLLGQVDFSEGIRSGVPISVTVAHKFGIREVGDTIGKQLHNCGIIYYPKHPYTLCIMTRGNDFEKLAGVLADVSAEVYKEVSESQVGKP